jgi:hypothetical protein
MIHRVQVAIQRQASVHVPTLGQTPGDGDRYSVTWSGPAMEIRDQDFLYAVGVFYLSCFDKVLQPKRMGVATDGEESVRELKQADVGSHSVFQLYVKKSD